MTVLDTEDFSGPNIILPEDRVVIRKCPMCGVAARPTQKRPWCLAPRGGMRCGGLVFPERIDRRRHE